LMYIADMLSRAGSEGNCVNMNNKFNQLETEIKVHCCLFIKSINITDQKMQQVKVETENDPILNKVKTYCLNGWPQHKKMCDEKIRHFYSIKNDIHIIEGILFKNNCIIIPKALQKDMLERIHQGHMGIERSQKLAKDCIYWAGINTDIQHMIDNCETCIKYRRNNTKQPLTPHTIPMLPWQKLGVDIFNFDSHNYLIVVDYYSQYFELAKLTSYNAINVICQLKSIFARHGIPSELISDNGPPFNSLNFKFFCCEWYIQHTTSSPHYPKSNGLVERTIGTVKHMLTKCRDSNTDMYLGLLHLRNAKKGTLPSPAELLMSRRLQSNIPTHDSHLQPQIPSTTFITAKRAQQEKMARYYNAHTKVLPRIREGDHVYFKLHPASKDAWIPAVVTNECSPHSYIVKTPEGKTYRRNREHMLISPRNVRQEPEQGSANKPDVSDSREYTTTRGRVVRPPRRFSFSD